MKSIVNKIIGRFQFKKYSMKRNDTIWAYIFIAPLCIGLLLFLVFPLLYSIYISLTNYDLFNAPEFIGLDNYSRMISKESEFFLSLRNAFIYAVGVPIGMIIALIIANILTGKIKANTTFRIFFFLPTIVSAVILTIIWKWMYDYNMGLINEIIKIFGFEPIKWFSEKNAMKSMIIMGIWGGLGISILLYIAAIKSVPKALYEAAKVDGANAFQQLRYITFPAVSPISFYILVTGLIGALQEFARFQVMTNGIPKNTLTPVLLIYKYAGGEYGGFYGYAAALAVVLGVIIMLITAINFMLSRFWVYYEK